MLYEVITDNAVPIMSVRGVGKSYITQNRDGSKSVVQAVRNVDFDVFQGDRNNFV